MSPPHIKEAANSKIFELKIKEWAACTPTVHKIKIATSPENDIFLHNFPTLGRGGANEWQNRAIATSPFPRQSSSPPLRSIKEGGRCTQDSLLVSSCDANHSNIYRVGTMNIWTSNDELGPLYEF